MDLEVVWSGLGWTDPQLREECGKGGLIGEMPEHIRTHSSLSGLQNPDEKARQDVPKQQVPRGTWTPTIAQHGPTIIEKFRNGWTHRMIAHYLKLPIGVVKHVGDQAKARGELRRQRG